jgi:hypothetical protein
MSRHGLFTVYGVVACTGVWLAAAVVPPPARDPREGQLGIPEISCATNGKQPTAAATA